VPPSGPATPPDRSDRRLGWPLTSRDRPAPADRDLWTERTRDLAPVLGRSPGVGGPGHWRAAEDSI